MAQWASAFAWSTADFTQPCQPLGSGIRGSFGLVSIVTPENEFCKNLMSQDTITTVDLEVYDSIGGHKHSLDHDRDTKYCQSFRDIIESGDVKTLPLPARSPNLNAFAERWVKSVKDDRLSKLILFGEASLRYALREYLVHYHVERNHQGKDNVLLFPTAAKVLNRADGSVLCKERLGGLLKYYHREAA